MKTFNRNPNALTRYNNYSREDIARMRRLHEIDKLPYRAIGERFGCSLQLVYHYLKHNKDKVKA